MATSPQSPSTFRFVPFQLDVASGELLKHGRRIRLQPQPLKVLELLLRRPGEVVTREELQHAVWPADTFVDFEVGLSAAVYKLRQTLGDSAETPRFIETIPRRGFRFIADVHVETAACEPPPQVPSIPGGNSPPPASPGNSRVLWMSVALVVLLSTIAGGWMTLRSKGPTDRGPSLQGKAANPAAEQAYRLGRYELDRWTRDDLTRSAEYFEQATREDPGYAAAWAGLARSRTLLVTFGFAPADRGIQEAKDAALHALAADPSLPEANTAMASVLMADWSWIAADAELRRAIALDANNSEAHQLYGYLLLTQGRADEGVREMQRAQVLDPDSPNKKNSLAAAYFFARRFDDAVHLWRDNAAVDVNNGRRHRRLAVIYAAQGAQSESIAERVAFLRSSGRFDEASELGRIFQQRGYEAARTAFLRRDVEVLSAHDGDDSEIATDYIELHENDRALAALGRAVERHEMGATYLAVDPRFDSLRSDARFSAILRSVGLPAR